MPLISLSQEAMDRGKQPEIGWSHARLNSSTENKAQTGNSTNFFFEFICESGPENKETNKGRYQSTFFNSKALGIGDNVKGFPEVITRFSLMLAALQGIHMNELTPDQYDTDKLIGKTCWIKIEAETDTTGKLRLAITDFAADGDIPF